MIRRLRESLPPRAVLIIAAVLWTGLAIASLLWQASGGTR